MDIGKHCAEPSYFLPFQCHACKKTFCLEHRTFSGHKCSEFAHVPQCPLCGQVIPLLKGENADVKVDAHILQGCPKVSEGTTTYSCTLPKCKGSELMPVICNLCHRNFCLPHRFPQDHQCSMLGTKDTPPNPLKELHIARKKEAEARVAALVAEQAKTNNPTAKKVALMKLKQAAKGLPSVPPEKRFYLEVHFPSGSNVAPKNMYFNAAWTAGKVLDLVAEAGNIPNNNNQANAAKLHLISLASGLELPTSLALSDLAEMIHSGDAVLLEYWIP